MKRMMAILVLVVAVPAMAVVNFTATDAGDQKLLISYASPEGDAPRGVALRVSISGGAVVDLAAVAAAPDVDLAFNTFIDYAFSQGVNYAVGAGHPLAKATEPGALAADASEFSISMGVLDQSGAQKAGPSTTAKLIQFPIKGIPDGGEVTVTIIADTLRGPATGVVGSVLNSNLPLQPVVVKGKVIIPTECVKETASFFNDWVAWGKPNCWCFERQCRGDINGKKEALGAIKYWVGGTDLGLFKLAYGKDDAALQLVANGICSDLNHKKEALGVVKFRVGGTDLGQFKLYYGKVDADVPSCPNTDYNFWKLP